MRIVLSIVILLGIIALISYHITVLEPAGANYNDRLHTAAGQLKIRCKALSKATEELFFGPRNSLTTQIADIKKLDTQIKDVRSELDRFRATSDNHPLYFNTFTSSTYQKSLTLKAQSSSTADQIEDVLDEHHQLLSFLLEYYPMRQQMTDELIAFNAVTDLNTFAGQADTLRSIAHSLHQRANTLSRMTPPRGLDEITAKSIELQKRTATAYESLADSLSPPVDDAIYASAQSLEIITNENEALNSDTFDTTLANSPILKGVSELSEKIDRFKF